MRSKHFKLWIKNIPDNKLILFDNGDGTFSPIQSSIEMKVSTLDDPGDEHIEFVPEDEIEIDQDYVDTYGVPKSFDAIVLSTELEIEEDDTINAVEENEQTN